MSYYGTSQATLRCRRRPYQWHYGEEGRYWHTATVISSQHCHHGRNEHGIPANGLLTAVTVYEWSPLAGHNTGMALAIMPSIPCHVRHARRQGRRQHNWHQQRRSVTSRLDRSLRHGHCRRRNYSNTNGGRSHGGDTTNVMLARVVVGCHRH